MPYVKKNEVCVKCAKPLTKGKYKFCVKCALIKRKLRYVYYAKRGVFKGQCTEDVYSNHGTFKCPNKGLLHKEGMCYECYEWNLKKHHIYPHKDNAVRMTEVYLVL